MNGELAPEPRERPFLRATWRDLVMVTWAVEPAILRPHLPAGTELDLWEGSPLASIVAFDFANTRVRGFRIPFHVRFPEVNLRFYVRRRLRDGTWRRGVAFVQEMVPRAAIALVARTMYGEPYVARPMRRLAVPEVAPGELLPGSTRSLVYEWKRDGDWERIIALMTEPMRPVRQTSVEAFIGLHQWGYTRRPGKSTLEYRVEHVDWRISMLTECMIEADIPTLYGQWFADALMAAPISTFVAEGSDVTVYKGRPIDAP